MQTKTFALATYALLAGTAAGQSFSLDDNPTAPLTAPPFAGLFSAEDPFGLFLPPVGAGRVGPSPTLGIGLLDGDLLVPSPAAGVPMIDIPAPTGPYLNAASADHDKYDVPWFEKVRIRFSVDRATSGIPGTDLEMEFAHNQQPADIYMSEFEYPNPGIYAGTLGPGPFAGVLPTAIPGAAAPSFLEFDESDLQLTAGIGPGGFIPPFQPAPRIDRGTHDNVDAFNFLPDPRLDTDDDFAPDMNLYTSIPPASAVLAGFSSADIFIAPAGSPASLPFPWAPAPSMGLDVLGSPPNTQLEQIKDDIDALVVWDNDQDGDPAGGSDDRFHPQPGWDYAIFSLAPGSASLEAIRSSGIPVDASTIFFTDFTGAFAVYLFGEQVGVSSLSFGNNDQAEANIDALEIAVEDRPMCDCRLFKADVNLDGALNGLDFGAWLGAFNSGDCKADQNMDGAINGLDFGAWLSNYNNMTPCP